MNNFTPQTPDSASSRSRSTSTSRSASTSRSTRSSSSSIHPASRIDIVLSYGMASPASEGSPSYPDMASPASSPSSASASASSKTVCSVCHKSFARPCDLNRHKKTHIRPFKCAVHACAYHTRGFPTDQERKRHVNDRHADKPPIYACAIDGCTYYSKRESNLKQHKEKTHDWTYDRSRPVRGGTRTSSPATSTSAAASSSYVLQTPVVLGQPFTGDYATDYSGEYVSDYTDPQLAASFAMSGPMDTGSGTVTAAATPVQAHVAWEEPTDQQLGHYMMSENQMQYADPNQHQHQHQQGMMPGWMPHNDLVAPAAPPIYAPMVPSTPNATPASYLSHYTYGAAVSVSVPVSVPVSYGTHPMVPSTAFESLPIRQTMPPHDASIAIMDMDMGVDMGVDMDMEQPADGPHMQNVSPLAQPFIPNQSSAHTARVSQRGTRPAPDQIQTALDDAEYKLPCPFRDTDAAFYARTSHERYAPCHTEHRYISTLLAAHNLVVDEHSASSFGVDVPGRPQPQPQAGLCRRCWAVFYDRAAFVQHTTVHAGQCARATHSKRAKYDILRQTFCSPQVPPSSPSGSVDANIDPETDYDPVLDFVSGHDQSRSSNNDA